MRNHRKMNCEVCLARWVRCRYGDVASRLVRLAERLGITEDDERRLDVQGNTIRFTPQSFCGDFETLCSFSEEYCGRSQLLEASC